MFPSSSRHVCNAHKPRTKVSKGTNKITNICRKTWNRNIRGSSSDKVKLIFLFYRWTGHRLDPWQIVLDGLRDISYRGGEPGRDASQGAAVAEHGEAPSHCTAPHRGVRVQMHTHMHTHKLYNALQMVSNSHTLICTYPLWMCPSCSVAEEQGLKFGSTAVPTGEHLCGTSIPWRGQ